ncbi:MAG: prepilin-type N-terminal cleavage/methylation domain-containing protein [Candidatus Auribacterota bacterium]|nr:prepilin-type N-terminal cleavage/methylation domain-containing protein [Candidatus Auribacterota bacterium]
MRKAKDKNFTCHLLSMSRNARRGFTPLENPAIYERDEKYKSLIPCRKDRVKDRSFLTGFTLIELLVAMAIIIILASFTIPSFRKAKEKANRVVCMNNLKQLGYGFGMYVTENDGAWPPYLYTFSPGRSGKWVILVVPKPMGATLIPTLEDEDLYLCPSDKTPMIITVDADNPPPNEPLEIEISYSYNLMLYTAFIEEGIDYYDLAHPAEIVVLFDAKTDVIHQGSWQANPDFYENIIENRHNGGANHLFADFHVEWKPDINDDNIIPTAR